MSKENVELVKAQFINGQVPSGSILAQVLAHLPEEEVARLKQKAAEGMLAVELDHLRAQKRFHISSADMDDFIQNVQRLERTHSGVASGYNMQGEFETASGRTVITSKKGCYIATAVYGSADHPNVLLLRRFRDQRLERNALGRAFCVFYYRVSPWLADGVFSRGMARKTMRVLLNTICSLIRP